MGLMDFYFGNVQRAEQARATGRLNAQAQLQEKHLPEYFGVMGMDYIPDQAGADGLIAGGAGIPGGLMAGDMSDPRTFLEAGTGLMAIPGYQQAGQQLMQQSVNHMMTAPQRRIQQQQDMARYQMDMAIKMRQLEAADLEATGRIGPYKAEKHAELLGQWGDKYLSETKQLREVLLGANTIYNRVENKGIPDMTTPDILALMGSFVKMQRPSEAVMEGDAASLSQVEGMPGWFYAMAEMLKTKNKLPDHHVAQLLRAHQDQYSGRYDQLSDVRETMIARADAQKLQNYQGMLLPEVPLRGQGVQEIYEKAWNAKKKPGKPDDMTEEEAQTIRDKAREEDPTLIDRIYDWYRRE